MAGGYSGSSRTAVPICTRWESAAIRVRLTIASLDGLLDMTCPPDQSESTPQDSSRSTVFGSAPAWKPKRSLFAEAAAALSID